MSARTRYNWDDKMFYVPTDNGPYGDALASIIYCMAGEVTVSDGAALKRSLPLLLTVKRP